jgi:1,2-diacylglycerol 3-alpha-glucosyltransferase
LRLALLFDHFGPYHLSRQCGAVKAGLDVTGVELYSHSRDYAWTSTDAGRLAVETVWRGDHEVVKPQFCNALWALLDRLKPDVVAIPGWSAFEALAAWQWCLSRKVPGILMSESCAHDENRESWKEWIKRQVVNYCSAALVGGSLHQRYLEILGVDRNHIFLGYDVVDNTYFFGGGNGAWETMAFLASARFIPKKNLNGLLEAYALYKDACLQTEHDPWKLILLGDGELRTLLEKQIVSLGLERHVSMPGFLQYEELPSQYAKASTFIHASTTEQWGLVVNEAMASGLPVLVSKRCGCVPDLVREGQNGFSFDPYDPAVLAALMLKMTLMPAKQREGMGEASKEIIDQWGPDRFGRGLLDAAKTALSVGPRSMGILDRVLIKILSSR